ncbi:uncharacterized protein LOC119068515 isoform X2 [Bradysia coprophila]|uniref:uncharacterized protein LOC119068515 isoform X2 n=1 Tax=Bradysia coprophila TaxID=38358 RepID=UPI00187DC940|nr:uncharacterized protein LOC119068515 isoform X2 [Bradysia coprophila]
MVQWQMYCPEQIIVPQKFPNILKTYAKAVIRTQPYDLLRWSAAYFRCLALNLPPPVKVRLEKESRFGKLTKGYLRVLVEQLGKGFFVQRDVLQNSWTTLSLPEEDLLKFLSLCRMLHWSQIHWLELFAVMVGSLNDNFQSTVQMLFELLTDDPEGGPSPIPSWMFNVCYSFIAKMDCSRPQSFVNGRKVLGDNKLEDENIEPDPPKIYSLDLFRYALIERFIQNEQYRQFEENDTFDAESQKSFFSNHTNVTTSFNFVGLDERENVANQAKDFKSVLVFLDEAQRETWTKFNDREKKDKIIQHLLIENKVKKAIDTPRNKDNASEAAMDESAPSTVRTGLSASMKFIGNLKNPYEGTNKIPDTDCVLMALSKEQKNTLRNVTKRQTGDERIKEELFRDLSTARDAQNADNASESEQHANSVDLTKGLELPWAWMYQFAAVPQSEKSYNFVEDDSTPTDRTPNLLTDGSFDFCAGHFKDDVSDFDEPPLQTGKTDDTDEKFVVVMGLIDDLMEEIGTAISKGNCDIKNVESICSVMSGNRFDGKKDPIKVITEVLQQADESKTQFENVDELGKYLKEKCSIDPLSKRLMECDIPIDENIATKVVPDDMILGLVEPNAETTESAVLENQNGDSRHSPVSITSEERRENIRMVDGFITDAIDEIPESDRESDEKCLPTFNCDMPALPGIGQACSPKTMDAFLVYILSQARAEKGMVYPRFLKEPNCPAMMNSLN